MKLFSGPLIENLEKGLGCLRPGKDKRMGTSVVLHKFYGKYFT